MNGRVLVCGAGIAGPAAAYWLHRAGYDVTVVERADGLRPAGQNVDVRDQARDVLRLMDLEDTVREHGTGEVGTRFVDEHGATVSEIGVDDTEGDGPTAELEILRGDLAQVLADACPDEVAFRFGDRVTALEQDADGVDVTSASGRRERYDLVVVADGVGSTTRDLAGIPGVGFERLGMYIAYATIERTETDDDWWRWQTLPGSRTVHLRPDNHGTTRAMLSFLTDDATLADLPLEEQRAMLREKYADAGGEVPRILDGLDGADDLYTEDLRRVKAAHWSQGRVVLLGDAAWCVTPIGGGGSGLAILGGYVLAAYLASCADHTEAFAVYDAWMRPLVDKAQGMPKSALRLVNPSSRPAIKLFQLGTRVATSGPVRALAGRVPSFGSDKEDDALPPWPGTS